MTVFSDILAADFAANTEFQQTATYRRWSGGEPLSIAVIEVRQGELAAQAGELSSTNEIVVRVAKSALTKLPELRDSLEIDNVRYDFAGVVSEDLVTWRLRWNRSTPMSPAGVQTIPG